jgi:hypothetical protein
MAYLSKGVVKLDGRIDLFSFALIIRDREQPLDSTIRCQGGDFLGIEFSNGAVRFG